MLRARANRSAGGAISPWDPSEQTSASLATGSARSEPCPHHEAATGKRLLRPERRSHTGIVSRLPPLRRWCRRWLYFFLLVHRHDQAFGGDDHPPAILAL